MMYALGIVVWTLAVLFSVLCMVAWWLEAEINMGDLGRKLFYTLAVPGYIVLVVGSALLIF